MCHPLRSSLNLVLLVFYGGFIMQASPLSRELGGGRGSWKCQDWIMVLSFLWPALIQQPTQSCFIRMKDETSLVVQWLRLCSQCRRHGSGSILDWGTKIPQATQCDQKKKSKAMFLSLSKLQRFQEPWVRNWGQRPNIRTKGAPGALTT